MNNKFEIHENAGSKIDPDFLRLIENSLISMTDYAGNRAASEKHAGLKQIMTRDVERANEILKRIAAWFEADN